MKSKDVAFLGPRNSDGSVPVVRKKDNEVMVGTLTPLKEGEDISKYEQEIVSVSKNENDLGYSIKTLREAKGPTKVNSEAFRNNWEGIFGSKTEVAQA